MANVGWCLVMANNKVTGKVFKDYFQAAIEQQAAPVHTVLLYGKRGIDNNFEQA